MTFVDFVAAVAVVVASTGIVEFWNRHSIVFCWKSFWAPFETCLCKCVCVFVLFVLLVIMVLFDRILCVGMYTNTLRGKCLVQCSAIRAFDNFAILSLTTLPFINSGFFHTLFLVMKSSHFDSDGCMSFLTDSMLYSNKTSSLALSSSVSACVLFHCFISFCFSSRQCIHFVNTYLHRLNSHVCIARIAMYSMLGVISQKNAAT